MNTCCCGGCVNAWCWSNGSSWWLVWTTLKCNVLLPAADCGGWDWNCCCWNETCLEVVCSSRFALAFANSAKSFSRWWLNGLVGSWRLPVINRWWYRLFCNYCILFFCIIVMYRVSYFLFSPFHIVIILVIFLVFVLLLAHFPKHNQLCHFQMLNSE